MILCDFLDFLTWYGINDKIDFIIVSIDGDLKFKCHLNDLHLKSYEKFSDAYVTVLSFYSKRLYVEAESYE